MHNFAIAEEEKVLKLMLTKDAQAWMDEFVYQITGKKKEVSGPSNFHVNMTYVLSAMLCAELYQPITIEGDYLALEPMTSLMNIEKVGREELSLADLTNPARKDPDRVYSDKMVFSNPSLALANHLNPIYMTAYLEEVPFKGVLIDGGVAVNVLTFKQIRRLCKSEEDHILIDLIVSCFSRAITGTYEILPWR